MSDTAPLDPLPHLLDQRAKFLAFVRGRVRDDSLAEDLLQEALTQALTHHHQIRDPQAVDAWFYRLLRHRIIDHWRRVQAHDRLAQELAREGEDAVDLAGPQAPRSCACVRRLVQELKPEYSEVLERVEVEGVGVKDFAATAGISASNAGVRVHRAREALRRKVKAACGDCSADGCRDCTCSQDSLEHRSKWFKRTDPKPETSPGRPPR